MNIPVPALPVFGISVPDWSSAPARVEGARS
jgi:hypothetical protein